MTANDKPVSTFATQHLFDLEISKAMIERKTFNAEWMNSKEGQMKIGQSFNEGLPFNLALSELELWCKGWVAKSKRNKSPIKLAKSVTTI